MKKTLNVKVEIEMEDGMVKIVFVGKNGERYVPLVPSAKHFMDHYTPLTIQEDKGDNPEE